MKPNLSRPLLLLQLLAGCPADDDGDTVADQTTTEVGDESSAGDTGGDTTTGDPFAGCDRGVLEPDLLSQDPMGNPVPTGWFGAGVDPATGALVDDGSTYVVSATYLTLRPDGDAQAAFGEVMGPIVPELYGNPGLVASQLGVSSSCGTARTFTVWRDQAAMMAFVTSAAHTAAIARVGEMSRGQSLVTHWVAAPVAEITWDEALARLVADTGPFY